MYDVITKIPFVISDEDRQKYINDIEELFANDDWDKHIPLYQTYATLFNKKEKHWVVLKERIEDKITLIKHKPSHMLCWAYVSFIGVKGSRGNRWHHHNPFNKNKISCVFYLQVEHSFNGTMFNLSDTIIIPKVDSNTLYVFDSNLLHAPTYWDYENATKNRIVLAIDAIL